MKCDISKTTMKVLLLVPAVLGAAFASQGCGEVDVNATETVQGELGSFGAWTSMGGELLDSPVLAKTAGTTLTAFGWGTDHQIWTTAQNTSGQWTGAWTPLPGGAFDSRPAVAAINVTSGPLVDHFAIVAMRGASKYFMRIQNQSGTHVVQDWTETQGSGMWVTAPSLVFTPAGGGAGALVLAGTASTVDTGRRVVAFRESLDNMSLGFLKQVTFADEFAADTGPALVYVPPIVLATRDVIIAAGVNGPQGYTYKIAWCNSWSNLGPRCDPWQTDPNGIFISAPALAVGTNLLSSELTLYGVGLDHRVWVANQFPNGGFSPIGTAIFQGNPSAYGRGNKVTLGEISGGFPFAATANSPF